MTDDEKILEWCGFRFITDVWEQMSFTKKSLDHAIDLPDTVIVDPDGKWKKEPPPIDLNFLVKWGKQKGIVGVCFRWGDRECVCWLYTKAQIGKKYEATGSDEIEAFKQALKKVIDKEVMPKDK